MQSRIRLPYALLIVASIVFVTLLVSLTGDLRDLWPLYGIPVLTAAVAYHVSGAVLVGAAVAAIVGLIAPELEGTAGAGLFAELVVGLGVFVLSGVVIGVKVGRDERRCETLRRSTIRDQLTGLHTREYFLFRLDEDIRRSRRYGTALSVLLIELDGLGEFNATVGTHRGDLLVSHVAEILPLSIRETDVLARIDTGLFGVALPFADAEEAAAVGERVRAVVAGTDFEGDEIEPVTHHTVSIGVAEYSHSSADLEDLLDRAGTGLAQSKLAGGDRLIRGPEGEPATAEPAPHPGTRTEEQA